jgi:hypothetical protein
VKDGIEVGAKVFLKVCPHGQPGTVVRIERNRAVVLWHDLDYLARHQLESLTDADRAAKGTATIPAESQ